MRREDIIWLLKNESPEILRERAEKTLLERKGRHVFVRGLLEFSNICRRNCIYCGLGASVPNVSRYRLATAEILAACREASARGVDSIVLQSGEGACDAAWLAEIVREISRMGLIVTLSVGERPASDYQLWREAGASRYLLKHETADSALYAALHPGHNLHERVKCLKILSELGYEAGSGFMVGLPGQSLESLADDILLCANLGVAMCGVGPFIPHAGTCLAHAPAGSPQLVLRVLSLLRLVLPDANLPATTALATLDPENGQTLGLRAGANVLMPSFTPADNALHYRIYDHKRKVDIASAARAIERAGRTHNLRAV